MKSLNLLIYLKIVIYVYFIREGISKAISRGDPRSVDVRK